MRSALALVRAFVGLGHSIGLVTRRPANTEYEEIGRVQGHVCCLPRSGLCLTAMSRCRHVDGRLAKVAATADVFHLNGIWPLIYWAGSEYAYRNNIPVVVSTRGMFLPRALAYSPIKKRLARFLYVDNSMRRARVLHATSMQEARALRGNGYSNPIAIIGNGIETSRFVEGDNPACGVPAGLGPSGKHVALFLSRIHPIKGVFDLIEAWGRICRRFPRWHLALAGPGAPHYVHQVKRFILEHGVSDTVSMLGPVYGEDKCALLRACRFLVLPSYSENFGNVVAEALASAKPVITTTATPWESLLRFGCGWWVEPGSKGLETALEEAMACSDAERRAMGTRARKLAEEKHDIRVIARKMIAVYEWCLKGGQRPDCVTLD